MSNLVLVILNVLMLFSMTTLGASLVYFLAKPSEKVTVITNGFAGGVMFSASIWSLLIPAIGYFEKPNFVNILLIIGGFLLGAFFLILFDKIFIKKKDAEEVKAYKFFTAVTIHNIPESLSVGFAFGSVATLGTPVYTAVAMAVGIAIQNIPEGLSVALPMKNTLGSKHKAFLLAVLSGAVEPIFGILGFFLSSSLASLMPLLLSFSAGSMIYVVVSEILPSLFPREYTSHGVWSFLLGFLFMLLLDVCF